MYLFIQFIKTNQLSAYLSGSQIMAVVSLQATAKAFLAEQDYL